MKRFEQLPHTADIKIRVWGKTKEELFINALFGMFQSVGPLVGTSTQQISHDIEVRARDIEALLVDFLSEALYLSDVHDEAYFEAKLNELSDTHLRATLYGVKITGFEVVELKAVTYHDLKIIKKDGVWQTDIVFDI